MPLPDNWTSVTLTGECQLFGDALRGSVTFTASDWVSNPGANVIQPPGGKRVNLDNDGRFSVVLPVVDDPDITPTGWTYRVDLDLVVPSTGSRVTRSYDIQLTAAMAPTVDLADLAEVTEVAEVSPYLRAVDLGTVVETPAGAQAKADAAQAAAAAASLPLTDFRPRGNRVAFIGDSITVGGQGGQAPDFANNLLGDSFPTYAMLLSGGQILHTVNAGISSNTTTAMLARLQADVISQAPDVCVILGGTNDNAANNPGVTDPAALAAITKANITAMVNQLLAAKILPVLCTLPPTSQVGDQQRYNIVNQMLRRLASTRRLPVVDFYSLLVNPSNGNFAAGKSFDAVHPNKYGYRDMGQAVATGLANVLPPWRPWLAEDNVDTSGLFGNNLFLTDTNADGIPDSWGASGTATSYTRSLVTDPNFIGKAAQNVGAPGASGGSYFSAGPSLAAVNTGDVLAFSGVVSLSGGDANGAAVQIRSQFVGSAGAPADLLHVRFGADVTRGVFYGECPKPAGATSVSLWLLLNGVGTAKFGQVSIHNLTALGVV